MPADGSSERADQQRVQWLPQVVIERDDDVRNVVRVRAEDVVRLYPTRNFKLRDLPAIDGEALHDMAIEIEHAVLELDVVLAVGRPLIVAAGHQPLVIPARLAAFGFILRLFLKAAVDQVRVRRVRLILAHFFRLARHGHEQRRQQGLFFQLVPLLREEVERLRITFTHGNRHQAAVGQLIDQRLRHFFGRTGNDDLVERGVLRPAFIAVADLGVNIFVAPQRFFGLQAKLLDNFDRIDVFDERAEDCGLITAPGADLQHFVGRLRLNRLSHLGDNQRRGDRL